MTEYRVLHLITRFCRGGAEQSTVQVLDALRNADIDYDRRLGFGVEHDPARLSEIDPDVTTVEFRALRHYNPAAALLAVFEVATYLRRYRIDILHTHTTEANVIGAIAGGIARTPAIIEEIHGDPITDDRSGLLNGFVLAMARLSAPLATRIVVQSEGLREEFLARGIGNPDQYQIIHDGVPLERYRQAASTSRRTEGRGDKTLLFVGRLERGKGLFDLLEAHERLAEQFDVELVIAGDGTLGDRLADAVDTRGLADNVRLLGYRDDIPDQMASADILVLPSYREGTPRVITEGLAAGLPVVATRVGGIPDQVVEGRTGFLIEPGDTDSLHDRLVELVSSTGLRGTMGDRARESVDRFDLAIAKQRYRELYAELVDSQLKRRVIHSDS